VTIKTSTSADPAAHPPPTLPSQPSPAIRDLQVVFSPSSDGDLPVPPSRRRLTWLWYVGGAVVLLPLLSWGMYAWLLPDNSGAVGITATASIGDLPIVVTERGELQSSRSVTAVCEVEGRQHKLVDILPEGTHVTTGQIVVRFDEEELRRRHDEQEVKLKQAEGKAKVAKEKLEQAKYKAEGDIADAELAHTIAVLERNKYLEGEYKAELQERKGAIALAEKDLQEAMDKRDQYEKFVKKGFGTEEQLRLKQQEVATKEYYLERDKAKLLVLEKFTRTKQETELTAKAKEAERKLARVKSSSAAAIAEAQNELEAAQITASLEERTLGEIKKQLDKCTIKAPQDGILVYANTRYYDSSSRIAPGATVWYRQPIFTLPDLARMEVKVRVHEAMVNKVKVGQKAEIRVDARPGKVLHGEVKSVGTLADNPPWDERGVKEYATIITINDLPENGGFLPNMTAEVRIMVNSLQDVLLVPVQGVTEKEGIHYSYVVTNRGVEKREVLVGENNDKFVEIKSGLREGEQVALDARSRIVAEGGNGNGRETTTKDTKDTKNETENGPVAPPPQAPPSAAPP
jgi:RND family efflux transporter MFP subunit